jgi:hypothetical protein
LQRTTCSCSLPSSKTSTPDVGAPDMLSDPFLVGAAAGCADLVGAVEGW